MRKALITALGLLAGCTTTTDIRGNEPVLDGSSPKPAAEIAQCFIGNYYEKLWRVSSVPAPGGLVVTLRYNFNGVEAVVAIVDITDSAGGRRVVARARRVDAKHVGEHLQACL